MQHDGGGGQADAGGSRADGRALEELREHFRAFPAPAPASTPWSGSFMSMFTISRNVQKSHDGATQAQSFCANARAPANCCASHSSIACFETMSHYVLTENVERVPYSALVLRHPCTCHMWHTTVQPHSSIAQLTTVCTRNQLELNGSAIPVPHCLHAVAGASIGTLTRASGSATLELGETQVAVAVHGPKPADGRAALADEGQVVVTVEFAAFAGAPPKPLARVRLSQRCTYVHGSQVHLSCTGTETLLMSEGEAESRVTWQHCQCDCLRTSCSDWAGVAAGAAACCQQNTAVSVLRGPGPAKRQAEQYAFAEPATP